MFARAKEHGVSLKPGKCHIAKEEVQVLGHIVSKDGIKPDPAKTKAIRAMGEPKSKKELKTLKGRKLIF